MAVPTGLNCGSTHVPAVGTGRVSPVTRSQTNSRPESANAAVRPSAAAE
jgi:hypothetical protein